MVPGLGFIAAAGDYLISEPPPKKTWFILAFAGMAGNSRLERPPLRPLPTFFNKLDGLLAAFSCDTFV